jgi:hypothetical protein
VHGARPDDVGICPRHPSRHRPIDLEGGRGALKSANAARIAVGKLFEADHLGHQRRHVAVGEDHGRGDARPVGGAHTSHLAAGKQHFRDQLPALHHHPLTLCPPHEPRSDRIGSADRYREAVLLAKANQHPPEERAARGVRRQVSVQRVAGEHQRGGRSSAPMKGSATVDHCCGTDVAREHGGRSVSSGVRQHVRCVRPLEPVPAQTQLRDHRRRGRHRIERAEQIAAKPRRGDLRRSDSTTWFGVRLQHQHRPTGIGQHVRRDKPVGSSADHDRVRFHVTRPSCMVRSDH